MIGKVKNDKEQKRKALSSIGRIEETGRDRVFRNLMSEFDPLKQLGTNQDEKKKTKRL